MRIAVVEDNIMLAQGLADALRDDGHALDLLHHGSEAMPFLRQEQLDLIILDINLPGVSGLEILGRLRAAGSTVPVLMLTARSEQSEKVEGLDAGADDYLTKPFDLGELKARVRALMRRGQPRITDQVSLGNLVFDANARRVSVAGQAIEITRRELALLELLVRRQNQVVSKQQLLDHLCGASSDMNEGAVELYIHRLRKRLVDAEVEIKTLRGLGYCLQLAS